MYRSLSICAVAALSTGLIAQATVPAGYSKKEGEYSRHVPLRYNPCRIQSGFDAKATGWTSTKVIKELWVRADKTGYLTTGFAVDMQVILSSKGCDPKTASMEYKKNLGGDAKVFMKKKAYKFAAFKKGTVFPNSWTIQLKGDAPFIATAKEFVVDWATYSKTNQSNSNIYVDAARLTGKASGTRGKYTTYGTACNPTSFYNYCQNYNVGANFRQYAYTRNVGDFVVHWLGAKKIATAIPGLKGCSLYTAPVVFHPTVLKTTTTSGFADVYWGTVPSFMKGKMVWAQSGAVDSKFTTMRMSRGNEITFGDYRINYPYTISHKYAYGFGSTSFDPDKDKATYGWENTAIIFDVR